MKKKITVFLLKEDSEHNKSLVDVLGRNENVKKINFIRGSVYKNNFNGKNLFDSKTIKQIAQKTKTNYALLQIKPARITPGQFFIARLLAVAEKTSAGIVYSDFHIQGIKKIIQHPLVEYQLGSIRDDFDFGSFILMERDALQKASEKIMPNLKFSGLYSLRLEISRKNKIFRIPEYLYSAEVIYYPKSSEKQFEYVDSKNREVQVEMEKVVTEHLKKIKAFLKTNFKDVNFGRTKFEYEASVIIPVKNREKTIADAVKSALKQKTDFRFNLIVIDNHSTDDTTKILERISAKGNRVIHLIPTVNDLGIGGCWNEAIFHNKCGKFAVQLDSDDLYKDENTLQKIVDKFYEEKCGMVIGSYHLTDFNLNQIPPGIIDHREWTERNGRNNALRINGLGAPRAFFTPLLCQIKFPNVSYGEDYSIVLEISRKYRIGRIYEPIYICRRWEGNTDFSLTVEQENKNNFYKDKLRTIEILKRQKFNI